MREFGFNLRMYLRLLGVQIRSQMQFRFSFWLDLVSTGVTSLALFLGLALVIERFGNIAGWSLGEIAFLFGMIEMAFGTMDMLFSGFDPDDFSIVVREGRFDPMLLRPVGVTWQVLGSRLLIRRVGRILEGLAILVYGMTLIEAPWTAVKLLYLPVVFASQVLAMGALFMMGSTITFWTFQSIEAVNILTYGGVEMMSYPASVYPAWMQRFFMYIIPFIFLNFYPALFFLDKPDPFHLPAFAPFLAPAVALGLFGVGLIFWRFGVNHYQGSGT